MTTQLADVIPERTKRIVVGVDGSPYSLLALRWAIEEAARTGREVHAVLVWNPDPLFAGPAPAYVPFEKVRAEHLGDLRQAVSHALGDRTDVAVTHELCEGDAPTQLASRCTDAAMLVLGSHGRGRLGTAFLGSVSTACVRQATCPVLIIPPGMVREDTETTEEQTATTGSGPQQVAGPWF